MCTCVCREEGEIQGIPQTAGTHQVKGQLKGVKVQRSGVTRSCPTHEQDEQIRVRATQPVYLKTEQLRTFDFNQLGTKFDVIYITPPLEEYQRQASGVAFSWSPWDWEDIMALKLEDSAAQRAFIFLWCGSSAGEGLDIGEGCGSSAGEGLDIGEGAWRVGVA